MDWKLILNVALAAVVAAPVVMFVVRWAIEEYFYSKKAFVSFLAEQSRHDAQLVGEQMKNATKEAEARNEVQTNS